MDGGSPLAAKTMSPYEPEVKSREKKRVDFR